MADALEKILAKLLVADNEVIEEGTRELKQAFTNLQTIDHLCVVLVSSANPQIRQYAAVMLRKRFTKHRYWNLLSLEHKTSIKQGLIEALVKEQEKSVKNSIAQLIGTIAKHEFPNQNWPELIQFLQVSTTNEDVNTKELGFYTLSIVSDVASGQFLADAQNFGFLFISTLRSLNDLACPVAYLTVTCMTNFVAAVEGDQSMVNIYHESIPLVLEVIKALSKKRPDRAVEAMELFDELIERAPAVIMPHLKLCVSVFLELASEKSSGEETQAKVIKSLSLVGNIIQFKKKAVVKQGLVEPILAVLFRIISSPPDNDDEENYFPEADSDDTPVTCANQILDTAALHLPPEKIIPPLLQYIDRGLSGNDLYEKKAAYLSMAMLAEGCADYIRTKHLEQFLQAICSGITQQAAVVRNAALFALGQFSEHLQPEISRYAEVLMPVLFEFLNLLQASGEGNAPVSADRMFYALEMFCENLGDALLPYLPTFMERIIPLLSPPHSVEIREYAISAVGAAANAAKEGMLPYFTRIIESLRVYLTKEISDDQSDLQVQALDTLGVLTRTVGEKNVRPIARESVELGLQLLSGNSDPDLKKSSYGLFASVSSVLKAEMAEALPPIVEYMLTSVTCEDGIVYHFKDEDKSLAFPVYEDPSAGSAEEEDIDHESEISEDENAEFTVDNAYVEEKEEAILALKELAEHTGPAFLPYLEKSFEEIQKLLCYPQDQIRKATIEALTQFAISFSRIETSEGKEALHKSLDLIIPKFAEIVRLDAERDVVMVALQSFGELLKEIGAPTISGQFVIAILNSVKDVMNQMTECQDKGEDFEEPEAEHDEILVETAGELIPLLGKAIGPAEFARCYTQILPLFLELTKPKCSEAQRSFAVGMIAECMAPLEDKVSLFIGQLFPILINFTRDKCDDVRNNTIFGLGEMALHGGVTVFELYPEILQALSATVSTERHSTTLDNICGAIARLIFTNISGVPLEQVLPVFFHYLPLRQDFEENIWIFRSFELLYQLGTEALKSHIVQLIKISVHVLHKNQIEDENKEVVVRLLKMCNRDFPNDCITAASQMSPEESTLLQTACTS